MAINFTPKVGQILECDYGEYQLDAHGVKIIHPDYRIPPEMIKNRLVVVLNGKIDPSACLVVPLSTTHDHQKTFKGIHAEIPAAEIPDFIYFKQQTRWAKADLIQQVSKARLDRPRTTRGHAVVQLSHAMVGEIQRAVIKAINASSLVTPPPVQNGTP